MRLHNVSELNQNVTMVYAVLVVLYLKLVIEMECMLKWLMWVL